MTKSVSRTWNAARVRSITRESKRKSKSETNKTHLELWQGEYCLPHDRGADIEVQLSDSLHVELDGDVAFGAVEHLEGGKGHG